MQVPEHTGVATSGMKSLGLSQALLFSGKLQNYSEASQKPKALHCFLPEIWSWFAAGDTVYVESLLG